MHNYFAEVVQNYSFFLSGQELRIERVLMKKITIVKKIW